MSFWDASAVVPLCCPQPGTTQTRRLQRELKRMIVQQMEETGYTRVKTGWFSDWYSKLKKDIGMA